MADYSQPPSNATLKLQPFKAQASDEKLQQMKQLISLSPIGVASHENTHMGREQGMQRAWLEAAKREWLESFDWRKWEARINSYPNFTARVAGNDGAEIDVHFLALFSQKKDAIPIAFYHGWPGSVLEFLDLLDVVKKRFPDPATMPYHIVVPSLPGYAYSSGPPVEVDYTMEAMSSALDQLMQGLGFGEKGYIAQGGDIGAFVSRWLGTNAKSCKGIHINMFIADGVEGKENLPIDQLEKEAQARQMKFVERGFAYAREHGTRNATIGLVLSASPIAMLSWIGEKFLEWTDEDPSIDEILASVTLYWLTDTFPRCIYPYRGFSIQGRSRPKFIETPSGYSLFPYDIHMAPKSWAEKACNLVYYKQHQRGGHFAAMERPQELFGDVEEFVRKVWKGSQL